MTLGGYVNEAGEGEEGALFEEGDIDDVFSANLLAGQSITVLVSDYTQGDVDLYLFDSELKLLDSSLSTGEVENIVVTETADYVILVRCYEGASNYTLVIGQNLEAEKTENAASLKLSDSFMPNEAIAALKKGDVQGFSKASATDDSLTLIGGSAERVMLLDLSQNEKSRVQKTAANFEQSEAAFEFNFSSAEQEKKFNTLMKIKALRKQASLDFVEPNFIYQAQAQPNDEYYPYQWHYPLINLPDAWDITTGSSDVVVAVADTGVLLNHPDLQGQLTTDGYDFISNPLVANDGDGADANADDPGDAEGSRASSFHGTHVAGTIAAASNNGDGVAGVAWNVKIMPIRVLGVGGGTLYDIDQGIRYAAGLSNDYGLVPDKAADVINLSLGGGGYSQAMQNTFNEIRATTTSIVVAAAGNDGVNTLAYPASYDNVISVSAVGADRQRAPYSNFGSAVDVSAPGGNSGADIDGNGYADGVLSTAADDSGGSVTYNFVFYQGTSMASPHVAGVLALMRSVNPDISAAAIDNLIANGSIVDDIGEPGRDNFYGHGLINAHKAVLAAQEDEGLPPPVENPLLSAYPTSLSFTASSSLILELRNNGGGSLSISAVSTSDDVSWLSMTALDTSADGLGRYTISVDRTGLAPGNYSTTLEIESSINSVQIPVLLRVAEDGGEDTGGNDSMGYTYVVLFDAETGDNIAQVEVNVSEGVYEYVFPNVPYGNYFLVAGSDRDNDFSLCDSGESCGAWPTISDYTPLLIDSEDYTGLDFNLLYPAALPGAISSNSVNAFVNKAAESTPVVNNTALQRNKQNKPNKQEDTQ